MSSHTCFVLMVGQNTPVEEASQIAFVHCHGAHFLDAGDEHKGHDDVPKATITHERSNP